MRPSTRDGARHPIARRAAWAALGALLGCAVGAPPAEPPAAAAEPAGGGLVVELHFGADADLDLYVSDPNHETAYFANTPVRSGGEYARDARCDSDPPRVERVVWQDPPAGHYRIGVDFPERCSGAVETASYRIRVVGPAGARDQTGEARFGRFDARVLEYEVVR